MLKDLPCVAVSQHGLSLQELSSADIVGINEFNYEGSAKPRKFIGNHFKWYVSYKADVVN
jgi:hypothetical protein